MRYVCFPDTVLSGSPILISSFAPTRRVEYFQRAPPASVIAMIFFWFGMIKPKTWTAMIVPMKAPT